jgi:radical SAM-linked protein
MLELRLSFEKRGRARYISHLDIMQVFRRAFSRAGVTLAFSNGFHPHPLINILLPLPTCFESVCELMDFTLDAPRLPDGFLYSLNRALPEGINAVSVSLQGRAQKFIRWAEYDISIEIPAEASAIAELFTREELIVTKRTKRGESEVNIIPLMRDLSIVKRGDGIMLNCKVAAGNESLNPEYVVAAMEKYLGVKAGYAGYVRKCVFDEEMREFR